jgi:hypothetical protein
VVNHRRYADDAVRRIDKSAGSRPGPGIPIAKSDVSIHRHVARMRHPAPE